MMTEHVPITQGHIAHRNHFCVPRKSVEIFQVIAIVCAERRVSLVELQSNRGKEHLSRTRFYLCALLYELGHSTCEIGVLLNRNPSSVNYGIRQAHDWCAMYAADKAIMERLRFLTKDL